MRKTLAAVALATAMLPTALPAFAGGPRDGYYEWQRSGHYTTYQGCSDVGFARLMAGSIAKYDCLQENPNNLRDYTLWVYVFIPYQVASPR